MFDVTNYLVVLANAIWVVNNNAQSTCIVCVHLGFAFNRSGLSFRINCDEDEQGLNFGKMCAYV
jgi:hypothetical protein